MERNLHHVQGKGWRQRDTRAANRALNCIITTFCTECLNRTSHS